VVLLPLTLIASIWGMNVPVPGEGGSATFWLIMAFMAALLIGMILYFRRRGWL
jgi:magnesium transporter